MKRPRPPQRNPNGKRQTLDKPNAYHFDLTINIGDKSTTAGIYMNLVDILFLAQYWQVSEVRIERAVKRMFYVDIQKSEEGTGLLSSTLTLMSANGRETVHHPTAKVLPPSVHKIIFHEEYLPSGQASDG